MRYKVFEKERLCFSLFFTGIDICVCLGVEYLRGRLLQAGIKMEKPYEICVRRNPNYKCRHILLRKHNNFPENFRQNQNL